MKKIPLHLKILLGMILGVVFGLIAGYFQWQSFVRDWVSPFGVIFLNLLKLIAVPLIITSLIKGIGDLQDISKFSAMGLKTIALYLLTTVIAVVIGLAVVNIVQPGKHVQPETMAELTRTNASQVEVTLATAKQEKNKGPLNFLVEIVPENIFGAMGHNRNMLQVIFFSIFFGICLLLVGEPYRSGLNAFFSGLNEVILKMVSLIMALAPYAVFALLASLIVETTNPDLFVALSWYALCVVGGLILMLIFYLTVIRFYLGISPSAFFRGFGPAQLLAFSTSSSAATLPVTMKRVEENLGVEKEVASFVCPVGATINMDGTSLYQAVAAVFICEALSFPLTLGGQLTIILTATLASIGTAAVPGAGMVMLVVVLEALGLPADKLAVGLALIFAVDRPLDMCRTTINVTGDATVSMVVAKLLGKFKKIPENSSNE